MFKKIPPVIILFALLGLFVFTTSGFAKDKTVTSKSGATFDCRDCHACDSPTKKNPCLQECPRSQPLSIDMTQDTIIFDHLINLYGPTPFTHKAHAHMAEMGEGCSNCHHHTPADHKNTACRDCHAAELTPENMLVPSAKAIYHRNCLSCHQEWSHDLDCEKCHVKGTKSKLPALNQYPPTKRPDKLVWDSKEFEKETKVTFFHKNHVDFFGLSCTKCHQDESCRNCHDKGEPRYKFVRDADAFHDMCNQCHAKRSCEWCHRKGEVEAFTHDKWPLNRYHKPLSCEKCHKTKGKFKGLSRNCNSCHKGWNAKTFNHVKVTGVVLDEIHLEADCGDCHEKRNFGRKPSCDACHDDGRKYPASKPSS